MGVLVLLLHDVLVLVLVPVLVVLMPVVLPMPVAVMLMLVGAVEHWLAAAAWMVAVAAVVAAAVAAAVVAAWAVALVLPALASVPDQARNYCPADGAAFADTGSAASAVAANLWSTPGHSCLMPLGAVVAPGLQPDTAGGCSVVALAGLTLHVALVNANCAAD